jgi:phosphonate transport system permease protein
MADAPADVPRTTDDVRRDYMAMTQRRRLYSGLILVIFVALMVSGFRIADARNAGGFWDGWHNVLDFPAQVWGEAAEKIQELPANLVTFLPALIETVNIAAASTLVGTLLAIVISLLATRGLARWPRLIPVFRRIMDIMRAIPEIVIALILIFVMGGGPVPAMIAIAFHTVGALGKLFSEVNENASLQPVEGLQSVGASWSQRMLLGVMPQVAPNYLSYTLLRFEINVRASAVLGFVGAGGIGQELNRVVSFYSDDRVLAVLILIVLMVTIIDLISERVRSRFIGLEGE